MSFSGLQLTQWLEEQVSIPFDLGPDWRDMPDVCGLVTPLPGAGTTLDGDFDQPGFQVAIRGEQFGEETPEDKAREVDKLLLKGTTYNRELWGTYVCAVIRTGGAPSPLGSYDKGRRVTYTCSYLALCEL